MLPPNEEPKKEEVPTLAPGSEIPPIPLEDISDELIDSIGAGEEKPTEPKAEEVPSAPALAEVKATEPITAPPVAPPSPPKPAPAPATTPTAPIEPSAPKALTREQIEELRNNTIGEIAKSYIISDADADLLTTEPNKVLPQLIARLQVETFENIYRAIINEVPRIVLNVAQQARAADSFSNRFLSAWPNLAKQEYLPKVQQYLQLYHQMNPRATEEDLIKEAGAQVSFMLKVPPPIPTPVASAPPVRPPVPALPGAAARTAPVPATANPFEALTREFETVPE
jgi:hypothetical protein